MTRQVEHILIQANTIKNFLEDHANDMAHLEGADIREAADRA